MAKNEYKEFEAWVELQVLLSPPKLQMDIIKQILSDV